MSTQSYYKDRLGFDPREAYDNNPGADQHDSLKRSTPQRTVDRKHHSPSPYSNNGQYYNNGNGDNNGAYDPYQTPPKRHRHSVSASPQIGNISATTQGGYEDALTQFKGTASRNMWEYFVESIFLGKHGQTIPRRV